MWSWGGVFDGVTDGITAGGASTYVMGTNNFSFGAWIYPTGWPSSGVVLATGADSGTTAQGFTLRINTANQAVFMICDGTIRLSLPVTGLPTSTWSFVFATVNRSTNIGTVYLNGTAVATQSLVGLSSIGQAHVLQIGPSYVGGINDERVYNRALSITEIQALYNAEK
jgi:hypothetical protein